jgi:hypothetical protein
VQKVLKLGFIVCLCSLHAEFTNALIAEPFPVRNTQEGSIGIRNTEYINKDYSVAPNKKNTMIGGRISSPVDDEEFGLGVDIEGQFVNDQPVLNTFTAHEFYFKVYPEWQNSILYLGRKKQPWSELDSNWQLGAWEPVFKVDPLDVRGQGLTGFFVDIKKPNWTLELFATPFFLPDHGPSIDAHDGKFIDGHPWVNLPPKTVNIFDEVTPAYYTLEKPSATDVVAQKAYALRFRWGQDDSHGDSAGFSTQVAMAYMPSNQLVLGLNGINNISESRKVEINIRPQVTYHRLLGLDAIYRSENLRMAISFLQEDPEENEFSENWTYQNQVMTRFLSPSLSYRWQNLEMRASYIRRMGNPSNTIGPQAVLFKSVFPDRYGFQELFKTELKWQQNYSGHSRYYALTRWTQELVEKSDIISFQGGCQLGPFWQVYTGFDLLKTENHNTKIADLAETYQQNDRAYLGVQYVF